MLNAMPETADLSPPEARICRAARVMQNRKRVSRQARTGQDRTDTRENGLFANVDYCKEKEKRNRERL